MEMLSEFIAIPAIVVIVYLIAEGVKLFNLDNLNRAIPVICGCAGAVLAVLGYFTAPDMIPAENIYTAIAIGIVSGLAATGANQIYKQLKG